MFYIDMIPAICSCYIDMILAICSCYIDMILPICSCYIDMSFREKKLVLLDLHWVYCNILCMWRLLQASLAILYNEVYFWIMQKVQRKSGSLSPGSTRSQLQLASSGRCVMSFGTQLLTMVARKVFLTFLCLSCVCTYVCFILCC